MAVLADNSAVFGDDDRSGNGDHCALNGYNHGLRTGGGGVALLDDPFADIHNAGEASAELPSERGRPEG